MGTRDRGATQPTRVPSADLGKDTAVDQGGDSAVDQGENTAVPDQERTLQYLTRDKTLQLTRRKHCST